ncbi:leucine-rich repeat neuronal protein 4 [Pimephales promelas]|uniref:leucine-rich repeat neuronal protein 4 n=1 Tax=Pimephales promelas TaxID=90988 RepID=UPI0019558CA9|nr:leucine-rich repeat neuronal protein 4 [Pimephales promelas]XP_039510877.1 leucine-rich repeat neuronal protein 4 [Pimephales promelas]
MLPGSKFTFLLVLSVMECVHSTSVSPSLLQRSHTRVRIIEVEDDYDEEVSKTTHAPQSPGVTTSRVMPRPCDYDPCVVQTTPCERISARTGCLCPGLTGPDERPETPKLREMKLDGSGEVVVYWCAPRSNVTYYEVTVNGGKVPYIFGEYLRDGVIPGMEVGEMVCVAAGNQAGLSEKSCTRYDPPQPDRVSLSAGIIAGSVAFLLLISVLAVVLWRRRTCRKSGMGEAEGLGNPSYTNDGAL